MTKNMVFTGIGVSPGIAIGPVIVLREENVIVAHCLLDRKGVDYELDRLFKAVKKTKNQLQLIREKIAKEINLDHSFIFDAQLLMLEDEAYIGAIKNLIEKEKINAEWAVEKINRKYLRAFENIDIEHIREKSYDLRDLARRIIDNLAGVPANEQPKPAEPSILVSRNLPPSYLSSVDQQSVLGIATEVGGKTSHISLLAKSLELPAVVGLTGIVDEIDPNSLGIIDGDKNLLIINPTADQINIYHEKLKKIRRTEKQLIKNKELPAVTLDGFNVDLLANIDLPSEVNNAKEFGARGIGLFRSEYIFMQYPDKISDEELHFDIYSSLVKEASPYPATIRILDIGSDKYFGDQSAYKEANPALGMRAIRLFLQNKDIIYAQLRAMIRASVFGRLEILIPFISGLAELEQIIEIIEDVKGEFRKKKIPFSDDIKIGIMIEIPSAALIADRLAKKVDFFSVGTNDLIQYTLAIDRSNQNVSYLYRPLHPAILKLLTIILEAGRKADIPVAICGEIAVDPVLMIVLLGLGYSTLSMNPPSIPMIKNIIRSIKIEDARRISEELNDLPSSKATEDFVIKRIAATFPHILNGIDK